MPDVNPMREVMIEMIPHVGEGPRRWAEPDSGGLTYGTQATSPAAFAVFYGCALCAESARRAFWAGAGTRHLVGILATPLTG